MTLPVFYGDRLVGQINGGEVGAGFVYEESWRAARDAFPISITMPIDQPSFGPERFLPWAANLLPEAEQLQMVGRQLGIGAADIVGLLAEIGRDTAGALSFGAPGARVIGDWRPIETEVDLEQVLDELPRKPFLVGDEGVSMSLAGVQTKLAVGVDGEGRICIPTEGAPSTHILKPDSNALPGSVQNEAFCLTLARLCGLRTPNVVTGTAGGRSYFLIARYDRVPEEDGWRRLHQEDFCQGLGLPPAAKYERNRTGPRGPTAVDMLQFARRHMIAPDLLALLDMLVFNILVCNTDAHAKNYSVLLATGRCTMAPLYDVMCAEVFGHVTRNLAQTIAGKERGEHLKRRHWERFFAEAGLGRAPSLARIRRLAERVIANTSEARTRVEAMPAGTGILLPECEAAVVTRALAVLAGLDES